MVICNQLCVWNRYKHGCAKPLPVACPLETALGNTGVANENPVTNGDRVRAMSDEDLANFLHNVVSKFMCEYCKEYERIKAAKGHANCNGECDKAYLVWLKQPAEEG